MPDYKSMYFQLFNKISDIISELQKIQSEMEEMYVNFSAENEKEE